IKLNKIVHPEIIAEINKIIDEKKGKDIVIEGALIIETKFKNYDKLIVVTIDKAEQIKRLLKKGKYNKDEINNILKSQIAQERKIRYADYIIDNSGSKNGFGKNVKKLIKELK
ncbi:MAG: dephospho-CoA kinase, partial [Nanoarchaeota archaeon]|nr:dephospho-CoA kinase [Nanoarchaeota archaeon]